MTGEVRSWQDVIKSAPAEWRRLPLKAVLRERKETNREDLPLLAVTGDQGIVLRDELDRRDTSSADKSKYLRVAHGDLVYNTMRMWQGVSGVSSLEGIVSPAYTVCDVRDSHDAKFLGYLCKLPLLVAQFHAFSQGIVSDTLSLRFQQFSEIVVPIPPATEQRKIATILASVDHAIEATTSAIEQTKRVYQSMLRTLMTRGIGHTRFKKSEIGMLPEVWTVRRVDSFASVTSGSTPPRHKPEFFQGGTVPWVKTMDLHGGLITRTDEMITHQALSETSCKLMPVGAVLCAMYGGFRQIGRTGVLGFPAATNQAISAILIREGSAILPEFLNYYLIANRHRWQRIAASSRKDPNITRQDVCTFQVAIPPMGEQERIVRCLDAAFASVDAAVGHRGHTEMIRCGLMNDLVTGRVRVPLV